MHHHLLNKVDVAKRKLYVERKLTEFERDGEVGRLFEQKLRDCGWEEEMRNYCKSIIRAEGLDKVQAADLEEKMQVKGKNLVPMSVREEMFEAVVQMLREEGLLTKEKKYKEDSQPY